MTALQFATRIGDDARRFAVGWERARANVSGFAQKQSFAEWMKHFTIFVIKERGPLSSDVTRKR